MNKVILIGRLTRDPELARTQAGTTYVLNSIAVNRNYTNQDGEREADFINFAAFKGTAETICKYFHKGDRIGLEGRLQIRNYTDRDGNNRTATEVLVDSIEFLQDRREQKPAYNDDPYAGYYGNQNNSYQNNSYQNQRNNGNNQPNNQPKNDPFSNVQNQFSVTDDDLPF